MTFPIGIVDSILHPPLSLLRQVLDTAGPYGPGSSTRNTFTTDGTWILPAGTYGVAGTYGIFWALNGAIPPTLGTLDGWVDPVGSIADAVRYDERLAQIVVQHTLLSGAQVNTQVVDVHYQAGGFTFDLALPSRIGIWVAPPLALDIFYLCLL